MKLTKNERSLLLYFESRSVDYRGIVDIERMNNDDMSIARVWDKEGFISFKRILFKDIEEYKEHKIGNFPTHYVKLSDEAWALAHQERRERADRMQKHVVPDPKEVMESLIKFK